MTDPMLVAIVNSLMKVTPPPPEFQHCWEKVRNYFVQCLERSVTGSSISVRSKNDWWDAPGIITEQEIEANLTIAIHEFQTFARPGFPDLADLGIETEDTPGSLAATTQLHRFSGLDFE